MNADVIIIGGGPAGCRAAILLAQAGQQVILIEKDRIGGRCLHKACIPTKAFAAAAGIPGFSWKEFREQIRGRIRSMEEGQTLILQSYGVKILRGEGRLLPGGNVVCGEEVCSSDTVILACGSVPKFSDEMIQETLFLTTETLWELDELPEEMTVIGAGTAGCELACALAKAGVRVTLTEQQETILPGWPGWMQDELRDALEEQGVAVCEGVDADSPEHTPVLLAAGRTADVSALSEMPESVGPDGFARDHLYFIGDMNGHRMTAEDAVRQAEELAHALTGCVGENAGNDHPDDNPDREGPDPCPWIDCIFTDPPLARAGMSFEAALAAGYQAVTGTAPYYAVPAAVLEGARSGRITVIRDAKTDRLLGAEIFGMRAPELIHLCGPALSGTVTCAELAQQSFAHPSYAEGIRIALCEARGGSPELPKRR